MKSYSFIINGEKYETNIISSSPGKRIVEVNGVEYEVEIENEKKAMEAALKGGAFDSKSSTPRPKPTGKTAGANRPVPGAHEVLSPIPGLVLQVMVKEEQKIKLGDIIMKMEAMKMENDIKSTKDGTITKIHVKEGDSVLEGAPLISLE